MIKYFGVIIVVNVVFLWLLIHYKTFLKINNKTAYTISGTTILLTMLFPWALSFLEVFQSLAVILVSIIAISAFLGVRNKTSPVPVLDSSEIVGENNFADTPDVDIPEEIAELPEEIIEIPEVVIELTEEIIEIPEEVIELPEEIIEIPEVVIELTEEIKQDITDLIEVNSTTPQQFFEEEGKKAEHVVILEDIVTLPTSTAQNVALTSTINTTEVLDFVEDKIILDSHQDDDDYGDADKPEYYIGQGFNAKFSGDLTAAIQFFLQAAEFGLTEDLMQMLCLDE